MLDRVIDAPAHQGRTDLEQTLASGCLDFFYSLACVISQALPLAEACNGLKGVDCLLIAKAVIINHLGIRRDCAESLGHTDLDECLAGHLVVLTEGCELLSS